MKLGLVLMATLMLASIGAGCGSGDDDSDAAGGTSESEAAPEQTSPQVAEPENAGADNAGAGDAVEFGDNGGIEFTFSGGHEESGKFVWIPVASSFAPGWWGMSFTEASAEGAAVFALSLDPANNFREADKPCNHGVSLDDCKEAVTPCARRAHNRDRQQRYFNCPIG